MTMLSHAASCQNYHRNRWTQTERMQNPRTLASRQEEVENSSQLQQMQELYEQQIKPSRQTTPIVHQEAEKNVFLYPSIKDGVQDLLDQKIAIQVRKTLPKEEIGSGRDGSLYSCLDEKGKPAALKVEFSNYQNEDDNRPRIKLEKSFEECRDLALMALSQLPSPYLLSVKGIAYVEEADKWGVVYEKIDGKTFREFKRSHPSIPKLLEIAKGIAKGLQILDNAGWPHQDIGDRNVMIRSDGTPVVIDLPMCKGDPRSFLKSRGQFAMQILLQTFMVTEVEDACLELMDDCKSDQSMDEFGWQHIIDRLDSIRQDYMQSKTGQKG